MSCDELRGDYELYALGVLEEPEAGEIRAHLERDCAVCVAGVRRARQLTALVEAAAGDVQPPDRMRRRVLALAGRGTRARWVWPTAWGAVATAAVIAALLFQGQAQRSDAEVARLKSESTRQLRELAQLDTVFSILNEPEAVQVVFGAGKPQPPRGRVFLDAKRGVLLLASNLPPAPAGKRYEMWVIPKGGRPAPAGMFESGADGTAMHVLPGPVDVASTGAVAVTLELEVGAAQPTSTPLIVAAL